MTGSVEHRDSFRPDLEGLRAVAVVLILLYHAHAPGFTGGYVGVDVFYVLSGFLITGLLTRELHATRSISLASFYARRARRILPAAFVVLAVTLVAAVLIESPLRFRETSKEIGAAAIYVPNILFANQVTDYMHPVRTSPVLQFWSLGVEEQFYLVWPAFLLLLARIGARTPGRMALQVGAVVLSSLALSAILTVVAPLDAFYLLPTRAWELGAGALLALTATRLALVGDRQRAILGWVGLGLIVGSALAFNDVTPFPGVAAVLPVLGSMLFIAAGVRRSRIEAGRLLSLAPIRYVGRISYSLYLWHWPILVLAALAVPVLLSSPAGVAAALGLAVVLAAATYRWIEDPLRRGRRIGVVPRRNLALAVASSLLIAGVSVGLGRLGILRFETPTVALAGSSPGSTSIDLPSSGDLSEDRALPEDLVPPLLEVNSEAERPVTDGCNVHDAGTVSGRCTYGDVGSATTVVLYGDSHALQWFPAIEQIAELRHWRLVSLTKDACPYVEISRLTYGGGPDLPCVTWRASTLTRIASARPALLIVASNHTIRPEVNGVSLDGAAASAVWSSQMNVTLGRLRPLADNVVVIGDTPESPVDVPECLSSNPDHIRRCAIPADVAEDRSWTATERAIAGWNHVTYVDPTAWVCPSDPCPVVMGRVLVFSDTNHLTQPFVLALAPQVAAALPGH